VLACVTQAGWGYNDCISQKCDQGTYNAADNRATCTSCPFGFTTQDVGAGVTSADCGIAAGFGWNNQTGMIANATVPCPIGTYNAVPWAWAALNPCTTCPTGLTTAKEGSNSPDDCNSKCPLSSSCCQFVCCSIFLSGKMIHRCTRGTNTLSISRGVSYPVSVLVPLAALFKCFDHTTWHPGLHCNVFQMTDFFLSCCPCLVQCAWPGMEAPAVDNRAVATALLQL
jgi:hypothetical protein